MVYSADVQRTVVPSQYKTGTSVTEIVVQGLIHFLYTLM